MTIEEVISALQSLQARHPGVEVMCCPDNDKGPTPIDIMMLREVTEHDVLYRAGCEGRQVGETIVCLLLDD